MKTEELKISASDGSGSFMAFVSLPETDVPAPAVVVIQEIFGVNANMREICQNLSQAGYIAVCPDLFWRQEPGVQLTDKTEGEWARAFELYKGFDVDRGVDDLKSTLATIRRDARCSGRVGNIGFCLGGKLSYLMATRSDADCSVSYYGVGIEDLVQECANIKKPLLMHIAEKDKFVLPAAQEKILVAVKENPRVTAHVYIGLDHAFARIGGQHYDAEAARLANARTADFLATYLADE